MIIFIYRIHWIQTIKQFMQKLCSIILFLTLDRLYVRSVPPIQELTHLIQYIFSVFYSSPTIFISQIYPYICIFVLALVCRVPWANVIMIEICHEIHLNIGDSIIWSIVIYFGIVFLYYAR